MLKIGIIREEKTPPDSRVVLTPGQAAELNRQDGFEVVIQPSTIRCYQDEEYKAAGLTMSEDLSDCDICIGVKEVPIDSLVQDKQYFFFSHTIKKQSYNRALLQAIIEKNITLLDYEVITNDRGARLIAFGRYAGMVGAHNALWTWEQRTGVSNLRRMVDYHDYAEAKEHYSTLKMPKVRIVLTGTGRVASGAAEVLLYMGIRKVNPLDYLTQEYDAAVFTQLSPFFYAQRKDGTTVEQIQDFFNNPEAYESTFSSFTRCSDIMINGIFWDNKAPAFFSQEEMASPDFSIKVISDVTCDIAPVTSIPSTLRPSKIADPIFGYNVDSRRETDPHGDRVVDMMTIDNLPNELPRDASQAFGEMFLEYVVPELLKKDSDIIIRAQVATKGDLGSHFEYLRGYLEGKE